MPKKKPIKGSKCDAQVNQGVQTNTCTECSVNLSSDSATLTSCTDSVQYVCLTACNTTTIPPTPTPLLTTTLPTESPLPTETDLVPTVTIPPPASSTITIRKVCPAVRRKRNLI